MIGARRGSVQFPLPLATVFGKPLLIGEPLP